MQEPIFRLPCDPEIIGHAQLRKNALDLQRALDPQPADLMRLVSRNIPAAEKHPAAIGDEQTRYEIEERRFPSAVWADDGLHAARRKANADIIDRGEAAEPPGQILCP